MYFKDELLKQIEGFYDESQREFYNVPRYEVNDILSWGGVILFSELEYLKHANKLKAAGKHEFQDFIKTRNFYDLIKNKKMVILNGNCHMSRVKSLFMQKEMRKKFFVYEVPLVYLNKNGYIEDEIISNADVVIHQDIRTDNIYGYMLSDEYIKKAEKKSCQDISIPNLFGTGKAFWPNVEMKNGRNKKLSQELGLFPYEDSNVKFEKNNYKNLVQEVVYNNSFYFHEYVIDKFNHEIEKLKKREAMCSVKIADYIIENYKRQRMFWDPGHPTNAVILEICRQIVDLLRLDDTVAEKIKQNIVIGNEMDTYQMPVYTAVKKALDFEWDDSDMRIYTDNKLSDQMDVEEFYKEYIYWCNSNISAD